MPKKKDSRSQSVDQRRHTATQSPFENEDTCGGGRKGDEANRVGGPAKGEDNRHRSWSSPLRTATMMGSPKRGRVVKRGSWTCTRRCEEARHAGYCYMKEGTSHLSVNHLALFTALTRDRRLGIRAFRRSLGGGDTSRSRN